MEREQGERRGIGENCGFRLVIFKMLNIVTNKSYVATEHLKLTRAGKKLNFQLILL